MTIAGNLYKIGDCEVESFAPMIALFTQHANEIREADAKLVDTYPYWATQNIGVALIGHQLREIANAIRNQDTST
jgi:hypothetical protein